MFKILVKLAEVLLRTTYSLSRVLSLVIPLLAADAEGETGAGAVAGVEAVAGVGTGVESRTSVEEGQRR